MHVSCGSKAEPVSIMHGIIREGQEIEGEALINRKESAYLTARNNLVSERTCSETINYGHK